MSHDSVTVFRSLPSSVHIAIVPRYFELVSWRSRITDLYGLPLIEVAPAQFSRWDRFLKRGFDIVARFASPPHPLPRRTDPCGAGEAQLARAGPSSARNESGRGRQVFTILQIPDHGATRPDRGRR